VSGLHAQCDAPPGPPARGRWPPGPRHVGAAARVDLPCTLPVRLRGSGGVRGSRARTCAGGARLGPRFRVPTRVKDTRPVLHQPTQRTLSAPSRWESSRATYHSCARDGLCALPACPRAPAPGRCGRGLELPGAVDDGPVCPVRRPPIFLADTTATPPPAPATRAARALRFSLAIPRPVAESAGRGRVMPRHAMPITRTI